VIRKGQKAPFVSIASALPRVLRGVNGKSLSLRRIKKLVLGYGNY